MARALNVLWEQVVSVVRQSIAGLSDANKQWLAKSGGLESGRALALLFCSAELKAARPK